MPEEIVILKWWSNITPYLVRHPIWDTLVAARLDFEFPLRRSLDYHEANARMAERCPKNWSS